MSALLEVRRVTLADPLTGPLVRELTHEYVTATARAATRR